MLKWKKEYLEKVNFMNNEEILDEYVTLLTDVDNTAVRSDRNEWRLRVIEPVLRTKLVECGFLNTL
jgi:hypothetical protein